jgi:hypothetical protein
MMWPAERVCDRDAEMRSRARANRNDPEINAHTTECPACREMMEVSTWMRKFAALPFDSASLPNPAYLWWKAQILRQWDAERRVTAPIDVGEGVQVGVGVVGGAFLLAWLWQSLTASAAVPASMTAVLLATAVILAITGVVAARQFFVRQ